MTTTLLARSLESIDLFAQVPPADLGRLADRCNWQHYDHGQQILGHMDRSEGVYFITQGKARAVIYSVSGKSVTFRDIAAGDMFGELSAQHGGPPRGRIPRLTGGRRRRRTGPGGPWI